MHLLKCLLLSLSLGVGVSHCRIALGSSSTLGRTGSPDCNTFAVKKKFYRPTQTPIFGTRLEVNLLEQRFAVDLSKKAKQQRQKRVNASCSCFCLPSFTLGSCQAEAVQVEGWLRAERCGAGPRKSGGAGGRPGQGGAGKQRATPPPPAGAAGMAQASECRNSLLYYYSVKFALSTYATLFSVGARVYLLSYWHGPHGASPMGLIRLSSVNISSFEVSNPCGKIRCHGCCKVSCALN